jgi:hypothetical protein
LLGRVRVANKFPDVKARMQPSDSLPSFGRGVGSPRRRPTSWAGAFLPISSAARTCAYQRASFGDESPALRPTGPPEERQGPPGLLGRPLRTCRGVTPRRTRLLLAPTSHSRRSTERPPSPSRKTERSASGDDIVFEATYPRPTRSRTYASPISLPRPSPGSLPARAGSPLAGRVCLDRNKARAPVGEE